MFKVGDIVEFIEEERTWDRFKNQLLEVREIADCEFCGCGGHITAILADETEGIISCPENFRLIFQKPRWECSTRG